MILVLSHPGDDHAKGVLSELGRRRHPAALVDASRFPSSASLTQRFDDTVAEVAYTANGTRFDLRECHAAWWRRPLPHTLHEDIDPQVHSFAYTECHEAFSGALALLNANWVNRPELDERAHHKPLQLATAVRVGLEIPRTLITNDPDEARRFIAVVGASKTIYKTFLATEQHWRETRVLRDEELQLLESVRLAPVIFQEYVPATADLRVTIVGDRMFATAITAPSTGYTVDYRMDMAGSEFVPTELPGSVAQKLGTLMLQLGLVYGAADFRRTPDGRYVFLEVNPAGEWLFVEERTQQPITAAMADLLIRLDVLPGAQSHSTRPRRTRRDHVSA